MGNQKKSRFNRRDFIKSAGATAGLALPLLNSQVAMGQTTVAPVRVLLVPLQHGWGLSRTVAGRDISGSEFNFTLPPFAHNVFNSIRNQMVFVDGLRTDVWGNAHDRNYSNIFTCSTRYIGEGTNPPNSAVLGGPFPMPTTPSLDWMIGNQFNKGVLRLSQRYASWGSSYHPLSFDSALRNLPYYTNARDAYMAIIDPLRVTTPGTPAVSAAKRASDTAMFSILGKNTDRLLAMLTGFERTKMENYLTSLNAIGQNILSAPTVVNPTVTLPPQPGVSPAFGEQLDSYLEMIRVAFTLDTHRVAVLGLGDQATGWTWTDSTGASRVGNTFAGDFHQEVAHYASADRRAAFEGYTQWYARKIVAFANTLNGIVDVDGKSLLENTIIVLCGEVSDGQHNVGQQVVPIIGGGGGRIVRNRWIRLPLAQGWTERDAGGALVNFTRNWGDQVSSAHFADLWVSIARLAGLNINRFGTDVNNSTPISLT